MPNFRFSKFAPAAKQNYSCYNSIYKVAKHSAGIFNAAFFVLQNQESVTLFTLFKRIPRFRRRSKKDCHQSSKTDTRNFSSIFHSDLAHFMSCFTK